MAAKLNQILAVEKTVKATSSEVITLAYQTAAKSALMDGFSRTYTPKDDEGDKLPQEVKNVQVLVEDLLATAAGAHAKIYDVVGTKDYTNCSGKASADVILNGNVLIANAPAVFLIWLEKELAEFHVIVKKLPVLDPAERWTKDPSQGYYVTEPVGTTKTKKVPRNHVKAEATQHHPAQVETYSEDVVIGYWNNVKFSGAITVGRRRQILDRIELLQEAVKFAREKANSVEAQQVNVGENIFGYLLAE